MVSARNDQIHCFYSPTPLGFSLQLLPHSLQSQERYPADFLEAQNLYCQRDIPWERMSTAQHRRLFLWLVLWPALDGSCPEEKQAHAGACVDAWLQETPPPARPTASPSPPIAPTSVWRHSRTQR